MKRKIFLSSIRRVLFTVILAVLFAGLAAACTQTSSKFPIAPAAKKTELDSGESPAVVRETGSPLMTQPAESAPAIVRETGSPLINQPAAGTPTLVPPAPTPTFSPLIQQICSPLEGVALSDLQSITSNPFQPPKPGMDDGHMGVDFAFYRYKDRVGMQGLPIHSVLPGIVSAALDDVYPYGNAIIIETPLSQLPGEWIKTLDLPVYSGVPNENINLTCPPMYPPVNWDFEHLSLYLLYAHMLEPTSLQRGDQVACGEELGYVGTTGYSVNDHLHLEVRLGPGGASFEGMTHYTANSILHERLNYCFWRVSGFFQMAEPMNLLSLP